MDGVELSLTLVTKAWVAWRYDMFTSLRQADDDRILVKAGYAV